MTWVSIKEIEFIVNFFSQGTLLAQIVLVVKNSVKHTRNYDFLIINKQPLTETDKEGPCLNAF